MRTQDLDYSQDYWDSLDGGDGYQDGVIWEDTACAIKEVFGYSDDSRDISPNLKVLDLGCAMGYLVKHLRRRDFLNTLGADISSYAVSEAPDDVRKYLRVYDLTSEHPPLRPHIDWKWDLIVCLETLEHIPGEDIPRALENISNALSDDGEALLAICTSEVPDHDTDPTHVSIHTRHWWSERLIEHGFRHHPGRVDLLRNYRMFRDHPGLFVVSNQVH